MNGRHNNWLHGVRKRRCLFCSSPDRETDRHTDTHTHPTTVTVSRKCRGLRIDVYHLPDALHEPRIKCFVIVFKINPTAHSGNNFLKILIHSSMVFWTICIIIVLCTSHSFEYLMTILRHSLLYAATPIFSTSSGLYTKLSSHHYHNYRPVTHDIMFLYACT